jgi:hypothetical protein
MISGTVLRAFLSFLTLLDRFRD